MQNIESIYENLAKPFECSTCTGCSVLNKYKVKHSIIDYDDVKSTVDILFFTESYATTPYKDVISIRTQELEYLTNVLKTALPPNISFFISPSVKCPDIKDKELSTKDKNICRKHTINTVLAYKPKLIFTLGNLALNMLLKKSGITDKHGQTFDFDHQDFKCKVVPLYHPFQVIMEPGISTNFEQDIVNAINRHLLGINKEINFNYTIADTHEKIPDFLKDTEQDIAIDIETTGLDFVTDEILTIAIAWRDKDTKRNTQIVIPFWHKENLNAETKLPLIRNKLISIFSNTKNRKIMHNAKFDLKFLNKEGIRCVNVWCTKVMAHLHDENQDKGLKDLVRKYFPEQIE